MSTNKTKNYSIQDAFKSLDMIEDEAVLNIEETAPVRKILSEQVVSEQFVDEMETSVIDNDAIDAEIERLNQHLHQLKEKYDKNSKSLKAEEINELRDAGLLKETLSEKDDVINEEQKINIADKKQVEQELADINKEEKEDDVEMVVDVEAETVDELKDSYIDDYILQCSVCHTLIYKNKEDVVYSEEDEEIANVEEACPHCKSKEGFHVVGKVAPINSEESDDKPDESGELNKSEDDNEKEADMENKVSDKEKNKESDESENEVNKEENSEESDEGTEKNEELSSTSLSLNFDDLNENLFNRLTTKYLNNIYENVDNFTAESGEVNEDENKIIIEGAINFKSGKKLNTKFIFEAKAITKKGRVRFIGMNESLSSSKKTFVLVGRIVEKVLMPESLTYNYSLKVNEELKKIYGRVTEDLENYKK